MGQPQSTLIDVNPFQGFERGVSRQHALLKWQSGRLFIEDLESSNGTYVNEVRLAPHDPLHLAPGDVIVLGQLTVEIYFLSEAIAEPVNKSTSNLLSTSVFDASSQTATDSPEVKATQPASVVNAAKPNEREQAVRLPLASGLISVEDS